ncbi:YdaU family protein [Acidovorax sp. ACV01]|uniref:YdaU family protein n=1 Tax=Acidovorax sp. ACV01 TaxID=2769311 RepID=UPI00178210A7|nr:YdaU family protein [Acidovorax sp. ACV01]MBD9395151.1 YdaU family protein [Acidovorax sp. ACV01]
MNHYPHHIGDFNSATRHLTFVERALYRELLDVYYDTERPLNRDVSKLARRVLAHTDEQRAALDSVLEEFFVLQDDGWHNARCDGEIAAYRQKQEQQSSAGRASAAKRKKKRAPEGGGGDVSGGAAVTGSTSVERPLNGRTTNQNQNQNHVKETSSPKADDDATVVQPSADTVPKSEGEWAMLFGPEFGVEVDHTDLQDRKKFWPKAKAWVSAGVSLGQMRDAVAKARVEATEGIAYLPAYVDRVLASMSAPPAESRAEAAARARMAEAAPLAAARAPAHAAAPTAMADGYQFFQDQAAGARALLPVVEVAHA